MLRFPCVISDTKSGLLEVPKRTEVLLAPGLQFLELSCLQRTHTEALFSSNLLCYKAMATLPFKAGCCAERSVRVFKVPGLKIHTKGVNLNLLHSDFSLLHLVTDIFLKIPGPNFLFP